MTDETLTNERHCRPQTGGSDRLQSGGCPARDGSVAGETLAEDVAWEMARAWRQGRRPLAEEYLARHPEAGRDAAFATRVIYEEFCLREGFGLAPAPAEILHRFPQWRAELRMLFDCHELFHPRTALPALPRVGETLGDYRLQAVLGHGLRGCVYLATQQSLADRPVVLKVTPLGGGEHLSLARLQHPHVVPLYAFHEFPERDLRALCMPYLGGTTLDRALAQFEGRLLHELSGRDFLQVLDASRTEYIALPAWSATRQFLAGTTYGHAVCWIGACLAEALHYAHVRGLVHLDLKPSNILLADDGQPMLLDFHLARSPLEAGAAAPEHLGGTAGYMSPEQTAAVAAARTGSAVPAAVDGRSDVYSLGVVLFELLSGLLPPRSPGGSSSTGVPDLATCLEHAHPRIETNLTRIVARCLAADLAGRYQDAASLAEDLRRHLGHLPLQGAPRRGFLDRWLGILARLGRA